MSSLQRSYIVVVPQYLHLMDEIRAALRKTGITAGTGMEKLFKKADLPRLRNFLPGILIEQPAPEVEKRPHVRINITADNLGEKLFEAQSYALPGESRYSGYGGTPLRFELRDACWWPGNDSDVASFEELWKVGVVA